MHMIAKLALGTAFLALAAGGADAATATRAPFGQLSDGTKIEAVTLTNGHGMTAKIMTLGATLQSLVVPDKAGNKADITLGYDSAQEYLSHPDYFGASVGRYANRIAKGKFTLDGKTYTLATNDGPNSLHGGLRGFDKRMWKIDSVTSGPDAKVVLSYVSADGEEGFPGQLKVTATYALDENNELRLEYKATTSKPTVLNLTNHSYFNLSGNDARDVMGDMVTLHAARFTPVGATLIPTGERRAVAGTPFDFRTPHRVGDRIRDGRDQQIRYGRGYDHNFIVDGKAGTLRPAAVVEDPVSGRVMEISVTAPGIQFYTGNFLDGTFVGKNSRAYRQGDAICLEPGVFPDSPNHPDFPTSRLNPGQTYTNTIVYKFSTK
ncbi:MAG: galactose mutarotase [Alphaproteobacteria bacterium 64-11]|nr:galactose mutarotase [Alphaproteobacteria bacterium]OJU11450.1 MAG: galactose mutarotase [Alphaproteobacteria bacterium 64-11]